jgi:hypothetical protein
MDDKEKRLRLREILAESLGAVAPGIVEPIFARLAADCGYRVVHLSGNAIHKSFCLPDRNLLTVAEIAQRVSQIADAVDVPLIVDGGITDRGKEPSGGQSARWSEPGLRPSAWKTAVTTRIAPPTAKST